MYQTAILTVMVSDMKRALAFYCDTLGMERGKVYGDEWADVDARGVKLGLHPGGKSPLEDHGRHGILERVGQAQVCFVSVLENRGSQVVGKSQFWFDAVHFDPDIVPAVRYGPGFLKSFLCREPLLCCVQMDLR